MFSKPSRKALGILVLAASLQAGCATEAPGAMRVKARQRAEQPKSQGTVLLAPVGFKGTGTLTMAFEFPARRGYAVQATASDIERITVVVKSGLTIVQTATLSRASITGPTATVSFQNLKAGYYMVELKAYNAAGAVIGTGSAGSTVRDGAITELASDLRLLAAPQGGLSVKINIREPLPSFLTPLPATPIPATPSPTGVMPPGSLTGEAARLSDAFVDTIGVCTHLSYNDTSYGNMAQVRAKLQNLGIRHIRDGLPRSAEAVQRYRMLEDLGIKSTMVVDPRDGYTRMADVVAAVKGIRSMTEIIEGPNEWDLGSHTYNGQGFPLGTIAYNRDLFNAINADPVTAPIPVAIGSMAHDVNFGKIFAALGNQPFQWADLGCLHPYPGGMLPTNALDRNLSNARMVTGDRPIIATETGYHTSGLPAGHLQAGVSETAEARYLPRLFMEYFNRGIKLAHSYELLDEWPDPEKTHSEKHYGLVRYNYTDKPSYTALKNLIALLSDPGPAFAPQRLDYRLEGDTTNVHRTLLQKRDGTFYLALWQEVPSYDHAARRDLVVPARRLTLSVTTPVRAAALYQPARSAGLIATAASPQRITLDVPDEVLIVKLSR